MSGPVPAEVPLPQLIAARVLSTLQSTFDLEHLASRIGSGVDRLYRADIDTLETQLGEARVLLEHRATELEQLQEQLGEEQDWAALIRNWHDEEGHDAWSICAHPICSRVIE